MKVIIIDSDDDERSQKEVALYKSILSMRGHYVQACLELKDLGQLGDLKNYDIAVCHRAYSDIDALDKEVDSRSAFRIIWTNFGSDCELLSERQSDQVIYCTHPDYHKLLELIEKGW